MVGTVSTFNSERAPCGRKVGGERTREDDSEGLLMDTIIYKCGCRWVREQYHDGSFDVRVVRHDGRILSDEHSGMHEG
ncbi:MAG: hypothetical protein L0Y54_02125 [Sporichthyaceae bacterium]|nr:hypothetical protein [Sporichthyaceae bacterium]